MKLKAARIVYFVACETEADLKSVEEKLQDFVFTLVPQAKAHELQIQKSLEIEARDTNSFGVSWLNRTIGHMIRRLSKGGPRTRDLAAAPSAS